MLPEFLSRFARRTEGAMTELGLFFTATMIGVGGLGVDLANSMMVKTRLQIAADAAAHAALVALDETKSQATAKQVALNVAHSILPVSKYGDTIRESDIAFGSWDPVTREFKNGDGEMAVLVNTQRLQERSNGVATYFLTFVGLYNIDVRTVSIFETYYPTCFLEGFVAKNRVDVQSNNTYGNGFCIHSNDHVEINNGNTFMEGVIVSMPDKNDLVIPSGGMESNPGLDDALRSGSYIFRVLDKLDEIQTYIDDPNSEFFRSDYVDINPVTNLPPERITLDLKAMKSKLDETQWTEGAVHELWCTGKSQKVTLPAGTLIKKGVLLTDCPVVFGSNSGIEDVIIVNTNTDEDAFSGAAGATIGRDDNCAPGGGAQLITLGGMRFPSNLQVYGGQLIAEKTISFAARPDGIEGVSIVSGDQIDGTSLINVGFCGGLGMDNNFMAAYFRLAT